FAGILLLHSIPTRRSSDLVPTRHLEKEDGKKLNQGESAEFQIIEFNKEFKRVVASHTAIHKEEEQQIVKQAAKKQAAQASENKRSEEHTSELQSRENLVCR